MDKTYNHKELEQKIYEKWEKEGVFSSDKTNIDGNPYSILMPPPNANAPLHCGHATYAIQDIMARFKRMQGYKVGYFPGTDHAGFETQVVYERKLKKEDKSRFDFDRETLYNDILKFVEENSSVATNQLKRLGLSADWERNTFMLDPFVLDTIFNTFKKMHDEGLVYRDNYMVNYSPTHGTTFSNLETEHLEQITNLYYVKYKIKDKNNSNATDEYITVATTRPETIPADVAIAVNPEDERYKKYVGEIALNPLNNKEMIIIADNYVDMEFGTGALKVTPAHDFNDYEIGKKHNLENISIIDLYGKMTKEAGEELAGLYVTKARIKSVEILKEKGSLEKIDENYENSILVDYKDHKPIEPMLLPNWFIKMDNLAKSAINSIEKEEVKFNQETWKEQILFWLKNIKDWPISRQTVFGIRIPVWYEVEDSKLFVVFLDKEKNSHEGSLEELVKEYSLDEIKNGLQKVIAPKDAKHIISKEEPKEGNYIQETDTFDTWFSSSQWPLTTTKYPNGKDFKDFFPTSFMDSMWDILFFWIARMIIMSLYLTNKVPFKQVYIHGRINDEKGQKMSKSKGNTIDPLDMIEKYGADALRMGIIVGGNTSAKMTSLSEDKVKGYRNFANKLWNIARFINLMREEYGKEYSKDIPFYFDDLDKSKLSSEDKEILKKLDTLVNRVTQGLEKFDFQNTGEEIYQFIWHEFADKYIESVKERKDKDTALSVLTYVYSESLKLLHPYMPFVTEVIWKEIPKEKETLLAISKWPARDNLIY